MKIIINPNIFSLQLLVPCGQKGFRSPSLQPTNTSPSPILYSLRGQCHIALDMQLRKRHTQNLWHFHCITIWANHIGHKFRRYPMVTMRSCFGFTQLNRKVNPGLSDVCKKQEKQKLSYLLCIIKFNPPLGLHKHLGSKKTFVPHSVPWLQQIFFIFDIFLVFMECVFLCLGETRSQRALSVFHLHFLCLSDYLKRYGNL